MSDVFLGDLPLWSDPNARAVLEGLCVKHGAPAVEQSVWHRAHPRDAVLPG